MNAIQAAKLLALNPEDNWELQVDSDAECAPISNHGIWVQTWVFVPSKAFDAFFAEHEATS